MLTLISIVDGAFVKSLQIPLKFSSNGMKSVIVNPLLPIEKLVNNTLLLPSNWRVRNTLSFALTDQYPPLSSSRREEKMASVSKRSGQYQLMVAALSKSAQLLRSLMIARSSIMACSVFIIFLKFAPRLGMI